MYMATFRWCGTLPPLYNGEFLHRSSRDSGSLGKNTSPEKFERDRAQAGTRLGVKKYPHSTSKARTHRKFTKDSNVVKKKVFLGQIVKDVWHSNLEGGCLFRKNQNPSRGKRTRNRRFLGVILLKAAQDHRASSSRRIGIAKGELKYPDDIDFCNDEIAELFGKQNQKIWFS